MSVGKLLLAMNRHGLNLYARTSIQREGGESSGPPQVSSRLQQQFIFKQSNVSYSECLCLNLSGTTLVGLGSKIQLRLELEI